MKLKISHERAIQYADAYAEILAQKAKSKSKSKDVAPAELIWGFSWGVQITGSSRIVDLLNGQRLPRTEPSTFEERVEDLRKRITMVRMYGEAGRGYWSASVDGIPDEIFEHYRPFFEKEIAERARFAALSPEEQRAERNRAVSEFLKGGGTAFVLHRMEDS